MLHRLFLFLAVLAGTTYANYISVSDTDECPCVPVCSSSSIRITTSQCWGVGTYRAATYNTDTAGVRSCLHNLYSLIKGQKDAMETLLGGISKKLSNQKTPFLVHLAGDNGVGKTLSAVLLSAALSQYPHATIQKGGEVLLFIHGSEYGSLSNTDTEGIAAAAREITETVLEHCKKYPTVSVIVLDEVTQLPPNLVTALGPIFSAVQSGSSLRGIDLSGVYLFVTSDFGSDGMTTGKSSTDVRNLLWNRVDKVYKMDNNFKKLNIVPFLALTVSAFKEAIEHRLRIFLCGHQLRTQGSVVISRVNYTTAVIDLLYGKVVQGILKRNGREVDKVLEDTLEGPYVINAQEYVREQKRSGKISVFPMLNIFEVTVQLNAAQDDLRIHLVPYNARPAETEL